MTRQIADDDFFAEAPVGLAHVSKDGTWLKVNRELCEFLGYSAEQLENMTFHDITHPDDLAADVAQVERLLRQHYGHYSLAKRYIRGDGSIVRANLDVRLLQDEQGQSSHFVSVIRDVTATQRRLDRLEHRVRHDPLTRLRNRAGFIESIRDAFRDYRLRGIGFALAYLDLDGFKTINDTMGHLVGDRLLKEVAARLNGMIGTSGVVARMGGDEFAIVLNDLSSPEALPPAAHSIQTTFAPPFQTGTQLINVTASIGYAHCPTDATSLRGILQHADQQMYANKNTLFSTRIRV